MKLLDEYFRIQQEIYEYFGYVEDWRVLPILDSREFFWKWIDSSNVGFADTEADLGDEESYNYYEHEVYKQRNLRKHIYEGEDYTMICVDTNTDGNKFLQIFDNSKQRQVK